MLLTITVVSNPMPVRNPAHSNETSDREYVMDKTIFFAIYYRMFSNPLFSFLSFPYFHILYPVFPN